MKPQILSATVLASVLSLAVPATAADDAHWLSPTMVAARGAFLMPDLAFLTFQHLDQMFATRTVKAGGSVWPLEAAPAPIGDAFTFKGEPQTLEGFLEATGTNAMLVLKHGKIVSEIYRNGSDPGTHFISFSMAKSVLAEMVGVAVAEGKIKSIDDKVIDYLPDWDKSPYANVTIANLLAMRSGVAWQEIYEFGSDTQLTYVHDNALVAYKFRWCDYARNEAKPDKPQGEMFNYSTLDTSVLGCVLEKAVGQKGADYLSDKIWKPAGMEADAFYIMDGPESVGREFYGAGLNATLRDYGRFGLMMLNGGKANGQQVIPADWAKWSTTPSGPEPASKDDWAGYAQQWWTMPDSDAYMAVGLYNQFTYVDPASDTVIVKLDAPADPLGYEEENAKFFGAVVANLNK